MSRSYAPGAAGSLRKFECAGEGMEGDAGSLQDRELCELQLVNSVMET